MKLYMHDSLTYNYVPRCDPDSVPHTTAVVSLAMPMLGSPLTVLCYDRNTLRSVNRYDLITVQIVITVVLFTPLSRGLYG